MKLSYESAYVENMNKSDFESLLIWIQTQENVAYTKDVVRRLMIYQDSNDIKKGFIPK